MKVATGTPAAKLIVALVGSDDVARGPVFGDVAVAQRHVDDANKEWPFARPHRVVVFRPLVEVLS